MRLSEKLREKTKWQGLKSIEFRIVGFLFRGIFCMMFAAYLVFNVPGAWEWTQIKWIRAQDFGALTQVLKDAAAKNDFTVLEKWISYRPLAESADLISRTESYSASFPPLIFVSYSKRARWMKDPEQEKFWIMMARYRLHYDAMRCGAPNAQEIVGKLVNVVYALAGDTAPEIPEDEKISIMRKVLSFDAKYPAADNPADVCKQVNKMAQTDYPMQPQAAWKDLHFKLRLQTDRGVDREAESLKKKPGNPP